MKIRIALFAIAIVLVQALPSAAQAQLKIAVVDMETAMYEVAEGRKARTTLESKRDGYLAERERRQRELNQKQEQLDAQAVMMTPEALAQAEEDLYKEVMDGQMYVYETEQEIMALNTQLFGDILEKMERVCKSLAQEEGYDMVLDAAVVYSYKPEMDITQKAVSRYDATK